MSLSPVNWATLRQLRGLCYAHLSIHRGSVSQSIHTSIHPCTLSLTIFVYNSLELLFFFFPFCFFGWFWGGPQIIEGDPTLVRKRAILPDQMPECRWTTGGWLWRWNPNFKENIIVIGKFLIPFGPWCGTDLEKSAEFCLTISPSHQAGQPAVTNSLIRINCTAAAAATSEKHEGTTFPGLNCSTKLFWYTQKDSDQSAHHHRRRPFLYVKFFCLLLSKCLSVLGGHQTNPSPPLFFLQIKRLALWKRRRPWPYIWYWGCVWWKWFLGFEPAGYWFFITLSGRVFYYYYFKNWVSMRLSISWVIPTGYSGVFIFPFFYYFLPCLCSISWPCLAFLDW